MFELTKIVNAIIERMNHADKEIVRVLKNMYTRFETDEKYIVDLHKACQVQQEMIVDLKKRLGNLEAEYYLLGKSEDK